jgi:hypothetical protein
VIAILPTRGSDRVIRPSFRLEELAGLVDEVLILHREAGIEGHSFPPNVILQEVWFGLTQARQYGAMYAIERGHTEFLQIDDDIVPGNWGKFVVPMQEAFRAYPWLGVLEVQSAVRGFFMGKTATTKGKLPHAPVLQLRWSPSQFWLMRSEAFLETRGFTLPLIALEDLDMGLQIASKGWAQACLIGPEFGLNRSRTNAIRRKNEGGFNLEEREADMPNAVQHLSQTYPTLVKKATLQRNPKGSISQSVRIDWEEYGFRVWDRWGIRGGEALKALLATKVRSFREG